MLSTTFSSIVLLLITFVRSDSLNPDRGLFSLIPAQISTFVPFTSAELLNSHKAKGNLIVQRVYYVTGYTSSALPDSFISLLKEDFSAVREAGMRIIFRFAYSESPSAKPLDAPIATVKQHLAQISPILFAYSDVVSAVQAGFCGTWGEWY
jgi:hypothetical protein